MPSAWGSNRFSEVMAAPGHAAHTAARDPVCPPSGSWREPVGIWPELCWRGLARRLSQAACRGCRMDRTERFYKIELALRSRGCVSLAALQSELSVSPATLKRDLQYLRDRLSAPIVYDACAKGYRFEHAGGATAASRHELPGLWFSEHEIHALLTMHQLLAGLDDDGVLARHLQPLMERLQGMLGADESA